MFPSRLNVVFPPGKLGIPGTLSACTASGIVHELALAATASRWEKEMKKQIAEKSVNHTVIQFYTMGDYLEFPPAKLFDPNPLITKERVSSSIATLKGMTKEKIQISTDTTGYSFYKAEKKFDEVDILDIDSEYSTMMDEITLPWSWGMKSIFQRFAIRKVYSQRTETSTWHLWPCTQPGLNNRTIDVDSFLWDHKSPTQPKLIPNILSSVDPELDSQTCYSIPYSVRQHEHGAANECSLAAMVEGQSSSTEFDDKIFTDLSAYKADLKDMDRCFKSLYVSILRVDFSDEDKSMDYM
jgi:hypothetical protein